MSPWPYPYWLAHRGAGKRAPENTLAAFQLGAAHGYRAFECDVKLSADGVPFLLHDATLQRTTNGQGLAGERVWDELARLDAGAWHSPAYTGEPLPRLNEVAAWVQAEGCCLNVEIKPTPGTEAATGAAVATACARLWAGAAVPPLLSSFSEAALQAAQAAAPALPRALLLDALPPDPVARARALGCVAVITQHRLMDGALCTSLHAAGLRALCYTVNDEADVQRLQALGVDGLITDAVDRHPPVEPQRPGR